MSVFVRMFAAVLLLGIVSSVLAEDGKVTFHDRGVKGGVQSISGKIESESVAGLRVNGRTVSSADVVDVQYEVPALIRLDYNAAVGAETNRPAEALKGYDAVLKAPAVQNTKYLKRQLEYKVAVLIAARSDEGPAQLQAAVGALEKFKRDHPDSWQLVPLTRSLGRLLLGKEPPDFDAARKAYDDLTRANNAPPEVRQEFTFSVIDLLVRADRLPEARQRLADLPANDARVQIYAIGVRATPDTLPDAVKQLEAYIQKTADPTLKAVAYLVLGDCYRRDPKHKKDALYAYLWVDVVYNQDVVETDKAVARLADLFAELKDEERAKKYRDRLKGK